MMNNIVKHLRMFATLSDGRQKAHYERMLGDLREVKVVPLSEVFTEAEIRAIRKLRPRPKECYKNAFELARLYPDKARYVEGYTTVLGELPIEHAFNRVGDKYVDVTAELALGERPWESETYMALGEYTVGECVGVMLETGVYGGVYNHKDK